MIFKIWKILFIKSKALIYSNVSDYQANYFFISNVRLTRVFLLTSSGSDIVAGSYKHSNGIPGSIKCRQRTDYQLIKQDQQNTYNVIMRGVRVTIFAVEKNYVLYIMREYVCVCVCVCC